MLGREPDHVEGSYQTAAVSFPSMTKYAIVGRAEERFRSASTRTSGVTPLAIWPAGLARFGSSSVVSPIEAIPYDVLPSQAGLAQLVGIWRDAPA